MTIDGQLPLTYFFPGEDGVIPIPSTEQDVLTQAENYFKNRVNSLPTDQRARFLARIREMAGQILGRIQEMRQGGSTADAIRKESESLFNQLKSTGDNFLAETERNAKASAEQNRRFDNFDQRLQNMKLELSHFVAPPPKKARDFKDMLQTAKKAHAVDMEAKKTQIAQCIQMEDPSVPGTSGFCIAQQLNGLSKEEQRELLNFVPNAVVGNAINQIAAVPVVVSKVISTVTNLAVKAVVKGAIAEAAIEAPHLREHVMEVDKALDGKNPEFNAKVKQVVQDVKKAAPNWMKTAGRKLAEYNNQLAEFDQKLHKQYRTIPGIIHEGVVGSVEVATMFVPIPLAKGAVTAVKRVALPLKGMIPITEEVVRLQRPVMNFLKNDVGSIRLPHNNKQTLKNNQITEANAERLVKDVKKDQGLQFIIHQKDMLSRLAQQEKKFLKSIPEIQDLPESFFDFPLNFTQKLARRKHLRFKVIGNDILFFFPKEKMNNVCVKEALAFAKSTNKNRVFLSWDPLTNSLAKTVNRQGAIIGVGEISRGKDIFPLKVIEVGEKKLTLKDLVKNDSGSVKNPFHRDFIIELFETIGYKKVRGGKGSHEKWDKPNSKMVIIPQGVHGELARGTIGSLMRTYNEAVKGEIVNSGKSLKKFSPPVNNYAYAEPFPHRLDYTKDYLKAASIFSEPKEFNGILAKDLLVVQYHSSAPLGKGRTYKWFMPVHQGNNLATIEEIQNTVAKLSSQGEISQISLARIPAGEPVRFLHGKALEKFDPVTQEVRPGGGIQYRFFDFDPKWIIKTSEIE